MAGTAYHWRLVRFGARTHRAARSARIVPLLLLAAVFLVVSVPAGSAAVRFREFPVSDDPAHIAVGPGGSLWFTETNGAKIGRITTSGHLVEFSLGSSSGPEGITEGPDGAMWFTEFYATGGNAIARISQNGKVTEQSLPWEAALPRGIVLGPDDKLWFAADGAELIGSLAYPSGVMRGYPTAGSPIWITVGPDGNLWFTDWGNGSIGRITTSGTITEFPVPWTSYLWEIATGPDGNLWFTDRDGNIGRVTVNGVFTRFQLPNVNSLPFSITPGPDGAMWFTEYDSGKIGRITLNGAITEFTPPTADGGPWGIITGPDGNIWFAEYDAGKIGELALG